MKKSLLLLCLLPICGVLAQTNPLVNYQELPDPKPVDPSSWAAVRPGSYVSFASADVRYGKHQAPNLTPSHRWSAPVWKGEKVHTQVLIWSTQALPKVALNWSGLKDNKGHQIPASQVSAGFVRYVMTDGLNAQGGGCGERPRGQFDSSLVADPIDLVKVLDVRERTAQPVWLSVTVPPTTPAGRYEGTLSVGTGPTGKPTVLSYSLDVQNRTLPAPKDWHFHLDLWQNPYSVARVHGVNVWSKEHFEIMRPYMQMLADGGQKSITTTIIGDPWQSQTEDVYGSMVQWTKKRDGTWAFDYAIFDQWVSYMMDLGIDRFINCYSMIPWDLKFRYYDAAAKKDTFLIAKTGTPEYDAHWRPMLADFARHLKAKGWFEKTTIAMDERPMEAMQQALRLIKSVDKNFRVSLAGNYHPEIQPDLMDYSLATNQRIDEATLHHRQQLGMNTTYYTCCSEGYPNTFTFSPPAEATFISWYAANKGYDGYLRWAYNCWVKDPLRDSRFRTWAAGDTYLVYPGPRTSIRFERLIEGIQDYEKIRILKEEFRAKGQPERARQLEKALSRFEVSALSGTSAADILRPAKAVINTL